MSKDNNSKEKQYLLVLRKMYEAQKESFFPFEAMSKVMERTGITEEEAMFYVNYFLEKGYIKKPSHRMDYFLRPGYIKNFPVTLTTAGISWLKIKE